MNTIGWRCSQLLTTITQCFGVISILHGLGNRIAIVIEVGELHNYLLFTWITVFFFNMAIPTGKVAVAAFLIEMNSQGSRLFLDCEKRRLLSNYLTDLFIFRSQNSTQLNCCWSSEHHPRHTPDLACLVPMQPTKCALGSSAPGSMQSRNKCTLQLFYRCRGRRFGLLSRYYSGHDVGPIENWSQAEMGIEFPNGPRRLCRSRSNCSHMGG